MRRALVGLLGIAVLSAAVPSSATTWPAKTLGELALESDVIVVGRLENPRIVRTENRTKPSPPLLSKQPYQRTDSFVQGTIRVERVLWSRRPVGRRLVLEWVSSAGYSGIDHWDSTNQDILWLLEEKPREKGVYWASRWDRRLSLERPEAVAEAARELSGIARPDIRVRRMKQFLADRARLGAGAAPAPAILAGEHAVVDEAHPGIVARSEERLGVDAEIESPKTPRRVFRDSVTVHRGSILIERVLHSRQPLDERVDLAWTSPGGLVGRQLAAQQVAPALATGVEFPADLSPLLVSNIAASHGRSAP